MPIPDEIHVFGRTYEIEDVGPNLSSESVLGFAEYPNGILFIKEEMDMNAKLKVLWHEAAHLFQQDLDGEFNEDEARRFSIFAHMMLVQNPEIAECYLDEDWEEEVELEDESSG